MVLLKLVLLSDDTAFQNLAGVQSGDFLLYIL